MPVTILRQHYQYELVNSQVYKTTIISTIKYDSSASELLLIPAPDILEDLEIRDSTGTHLTVLSDSELLHKFGLNKSELLSENKEYRNLSDDRSDIIAVLIPPSASEYQKVFCTYTAAIREDRYAKTKFSPDMSIQFKFRIVPSEYMLSIIEKQPFDVHIMFKIKDDYRINDDYKINIYPKSDRKILKSNENTEHSISWFVPKMEFGDVAVGMVNLGLSYSLLNSARTVTAISALAPLMLIGIQLYFQKFFIPTLEIIGGAIALLVGSQFWILKDRYLLSRWKRLQTYLVALNSILFAVWLVIWAAYF